VEFKFWAISRIERWKACRIAVLARRRLRGPERVHRDAAQARHSGKRRKRLQAGCPYPQSYPSRDKKKAGHEDLPKG